MNLKINLIARTNGVGLDRDVRLVKAAAEACGAEVTVSHSRGRSWWRRWWPGRPAYDVNIFMERLFPGWFGAARVQILIPNQERFPRRQVPLLKKVNQVWAKSRHAQQRFKTVAASVNYTSFTSEDLWDGTSGSDLPLKVLHLAGRSTLKGTEDVLHLWERHPEWPPLTLIISRENAPKTVPANVVLRSGYLEDAEIAQMYNEHLVHVCPSRSEGWGHYLVEALFCEALVVTTDGPPMNEVVTAERGVLVPVTREEPRHLGTNFYVDSAALEKQLEQVFAMTAEERAILGKAGRKWAKENDNLFQNRVGELLRELADQKER